MTRHHQTFCLGSLYGELNWDCIWGHCCQGHCAENGMCQQFLSDQNQTCCIASLKRDLAGEYILGHAFTKSTPDSQ